MNNAVSYKTKQFFFVLIKLSIVVGAFYFIYNKLVNNGAIDFSEFITYLTKNNVFSTENILFLLFLSSFNWFLEILKWQKLVSYIKKVSFFEALQQSLGSLTASLFTPNRIGEYGAKAIYFSKQFRKRILLLNLIGNMMQMAVTVIFGCIGFLFFVSQYPIEINAYRVTRLVIIVLMVFGLLFIGSKQKKFKIKGFSFEKVKQFIKDLPFSISGFSFLISVSRYLVFSFQFYFLLHLFGVELAYLEAMIIITSMYLLASIIPTLFILDVVVKGSVAVYLFSFPGVNEFTILSIITIMWLLNFVLPSVFGSYYVLNFNVEKQNDSL
ncbi:lysylphosphatidylglycerol synthase domain-containing protein [Lacinutrix jangbogonensis]|uniref:lysylphosphatidylglycerol synthase domain-containing protein n=1 Tax=Lacinutrix jangbogonensis TaxID=1469557 RepID=UPI00053EDC4D|nr:lysylphosphatidylglycerol synthase domain-containing protein [Lacinutrix jangbogonensis]